MGFDCLDPCLLLLGSEILELVDDFGKVSVLGFYGAWGGYETS